MISDKDFAGFHDTGIWSWNTGSDELSISEKVYLKLGYSSYGQPLPIESLKRVCFPDDLPLLEGLPGEDYSLFMLRLRHRNGSFIPFLIQFSSDSGKEQDDRRIISGCATDVSSITAVTEIDSHNDFVQRLSSFGKLAGKVSHDLSNILNGITGFAEIIRFQLEENGTVSDYCGRILNSCDKISDIISGFRDLSGNKKIRDGKSDLHEVIRKTADLLSFSLDDDVRISLNLDAECSSVGISPPLLQAALLNLGINARDALTEGGEIVFSTSLEKLDSDYCRMSPFSLSPGKYIRLQISDTGTGIEPGVLKYIFDPLFTTREGERGRGMGLTTVYFTITSHGGAVSVETAPGKGTAMIIFLPQG